MAAHVASTATYFFFDFFLDFSAGSVDLAGSVDRDDKKSAWVGCFNGRNIGAEFVAPIVERTTKKARLLILQTGSGDPSILAFEAYADTLGDAFTVPRGQSTPPRVGK